jgi:hypothetical protein
MAGGAVAGRPGLRRRALRTDRRFRHRIDRRPQFRAEIEDSASDSTARERARSRHRAGELAFDAIK